MRGEKRANKYAINYDDSRFTEVEEDKQTALSELESTYADMINDSDQYYQSQIDAAKNYADTQSQLQQEQTDFAIEKIEQEKEQAKTDYLKEQSGAYVDWQKQSNQYGSNAEKMAAAGLANTGYSESAQVSMYNTYQNRLATARESYNKAVLNYNNSITEARLQNNSVLAEIAYNALQTQLALSLEGFQYKNQLILDKYNKKTEIDNTYYSRYQDVLAQINTENALAEQVRQFNANKSLQYAQLAESKRQYNKSLEEQQRQFNITNGVTTQRMATLSDGSKVDLNLFYKNDSRDAATLASILDLGYGPIDTKDLNQLIKEGKVEKYNKNGITLYRNKTNAGKKAAKDVLGLVDRGM